MPTTIALILGLALSLLAEATVRPYVSVRTRAAMALVVFFVVAYATRRALLRLLDGGE